MRAMRRIKQQLPEEECLAILRNASAGVLAVTGDEGYPYAVPLSFVYDEGRLFFHSALTGHKVDAIRRDGRASFCIIDQDQVVPAKYTTYFRSVIAFGQARILTDDAEKRSALEKLAAKYSPAQAEGRMAEIERSFDRLCIIELAITHFTGKEAIELTRARDEIG